MSEAIGTFVYNLLQIIQAEWFLYFAIVWVSIAVVYESLRKWELFRTLSSLIRQPIISSSRIENDNASNDDDHIDSTREQFWFYPRELFEQLTRILTSFFSLPIKKNVFPFATKLADGVYPFKATSTKATFLAILFAIFLSLFTYGDAISIANGLDALGLVRGQIPTFLLNYEVSVGIASFLAIIVGFFMLFQSYASESDAQPPSLERENNPSDLIHFRSNKLRALIRSISLFTILMGIAVAALLGIGRIMALGYWTDNETLRLTVQFGINVLTLINGILAAALVFEEGMTGYTIILSLILWVLILFLLLLDVFLYIGIRSLLFAIDIAWRAVLVTIGFIYFIVISPIIAIVQLIFLPFHSLK